jgi:hypothetical protein
MGTPERNTRPRRARRRRVTRLAAVEQTLAAPEHLEVDRRAGGHRGQGRHRRARPVGTEPAAATAGAGSARLRRQARQPAGTAASPWQRREQRQAHHPRTIASDMGLPPLITVSSPTLPEPGELGARFSVEPPASANNAAALREPCSSTSRRCQREPRRYLPARR